MTGPQTAAPGAVYSSLASNHELAELVALYVEEMPQRIEALESCWRSGDLAQLARLAHQIKGAAGSYGFQEVTPVAARLEAAARQQKDVIPEALQALLDMCRQLRAGCPGGE